MLYHFSKNKSSKLTRNIYIKSISPKDQKNHSNFYSGLRDFSDLLQYYVVALQLKSLKGGRKKKGKVCRPDLFCLLFQQLTIQTTSHQTAKIFTNFNGNFSISSCCWKWLDVFCMIFSLFNRFYKHMRVLISSWLSRSELVFLSGTSQARKWFKVAGNYTNKIFMEADYAKTLIYISGYLYFI